MRFSLSTKMNETTKEDTEGQIIHTEVCQREEWPKGTSQAEAASKSVPLPTELCQFEGNRQAVY